MIHQNKLFLQNFLEETKFNDFKDFSKCADTLYKEGLFSQID